MSHRKFAAALSLGAVVSACAAAAPRGPSGYFLMTTPDAKSTLRMDATGLDGPDTNIAKDGGAYRGRFGGELVDLRIVNDKVNGFIGQRTEFVVSGATTSLLVQGLVRGRLSRFELDEEKLVGNLGHCSYDLKRATSGEGYDGYRSCGGSPRPTHVGLPPVLEASSKEERAVYLALFLSQ